MSESHESINSYHPGCLSREGGGHSIVIDSEKDGCILIRTGDLDDRVLIDCVLFRVDHWVRGPMLHYKVKGG